MTSKEQFEAWLEREQGLYGEDIEWQPERNCYARFGIHLAWCAWQESREELQIKIPQSRLSSYTATDEERGRDYAYNEALNDCAKAIRIEGLKVKGG